MKNDKLEELAAERSQTTNEIFAPNDFYGQAYLIKKYCKIDQKASLPGIYPHGVSFKDKVWITEIKHPLPFVLLKSKIHQEIYSKYSNKDAWIIGGPNYYAVRLIEDEINEIRLKAKGTLVLPAHSTHHLTNDYDFAGFVEYLKNLPEKFRPITICLGWRDIQLKKHEQYLKQGFKCTTAGHIYDNNFLFRLFRNIAAHQFAITNHIGTSAFYAAAMDLPVILYQQEIETKPSRPDQPVYLLQEAQPSTYLPLVEKFIDCCNNPQPNMVKRQKEIASLLLGIDFVQEPEELRNLLESLWQRTEMKPFLKNTQYLIQGSFKDVIQTIGAKIKSYPRRTPGRLKIDGISISYVDLHSFYHQAIQIFQDHLYDFKTQKDNPIIIDCGAHIGLASIYFSIRYPEGKIYAFEADTAIAKILKENVLSFGLKNVETFEKAIWINDNGVFFQNTNDDSGFIKKTKHKDCIRVPSIRLKNFLKDKEIDLLKLDIEGAEYDVITDCNDVLKNVKNIIIEVHKFRDQNESLASILNILEKNNFQYTLGDLHSAEWIETQIEIPFDAVNSDKYIITIFAWQDLTKKLTYEPGHMPSADCKYELIERCIQYLNSNDNDYAFKLIDQAIEKYPDIPALNYGKAIIFARMGKKQEAIDILKKLLEEQPNHKNAQTLFEALN